MREHKKSARPTAATVKRAKLEAGIGRATTSVHNDTTAQPEGQGFRVADFLRPGQKNAVPLKRLKELFDLDRRTVRLMIWTERLRGVPILADNQTGYFLPADDRERARCVQSMRRRTAEIVKAADAIEKAR